MKQNILVIGSDNFVGLRVIQALKTSDWAAALPAAQASDLSVQMLGNVTGIVNCTMGGPTRILSSAQRLYETINGIDRRARIVHLSSMTVYGSVAQEVNENTPLLANLGAYGAAHIRAEEIVNLYPNTVTLRPGCEYGPGCPQWSEKIARLLQAHRLGDLGVMGDGFCNLIYIDDLVKTILVALRFPNLGGERFNLGMPSPPTWNEYLISFGVALGAVPVRRITARRLKFETKLLALPLKTAEMITNRLNIGAAHAVPSITPSFLRLCGQRIRLDSAKAERVLNLSCTALNEGVKNSAIDLSRRSRNQGFP